MTNDNIIKRVLEIFNSELDYDYDQGGFFLVSRTKQDILENEFGYIDDDKYLEIEAELNSTKNEVGVVI